MPGMLPIDRVRRISAQARERFDRARHRFGVKRAQLETKARAHDDGRDEPEPAATDAAVSRRADAGDEDPGQ